MLTLGFNENNACEASQEESELKALLNSDSVRLLTQEQWVGMIDLYLSACRGTSPQRAERDRLKGADR